ncbi:MAG: insulinase family protein [Gemmatimonadota bacterium]|nr:insulinase family protein [Gemmatimonadota bacterium]
MRTPPMFARRALAIAALALAGTAAPPPAVLGQATHPSAAPELRIPYARYTLPNGLTVILAEDHSTPTVAVDVWYHVGSKNEKPGRTGFAHLFEHVMFTGSGHVPYGMHDRYTEGVGGGNNGSTTNDRTNYYETVPSNYLEDELWLESDRMGWLLDALDTGKLDAQRDIVKNERRQSYDNRPYGRAGEIVSGAMYPDDHPYHWPVIGSMTDLSAASAEDVKNFFRLYYAPNNATLAIVGDFEPAEAKAWVAKYFGEIPRGQAIVRPTAGPVTLAAEKRLVYEDRVQIPRLYVTWPTVGVRRDDQYALDVLGAILTGSRTARLTKALVYDRQSAASVFAYQDENELVGQFQVIVIPRPGTTLTGLELAADSIIDRLKREGPTARELQKVKAGLELGAISSLQSNLGKAEMLDQGSVFHGDPGYFRTDLARTQAVTAADVKRVANRYLTNGRVVLSIVPLGKLDEASKPEASTRVSAVPAPTSTIAGEDRP